MKSIGPSNYNYITSNANILVQILIHLNSFIDRDIKKEADRQGLPVAMILFDEWGTSGQIRPTVEHLYKLLNLIPLYRASDYIAENILKISPAERPLNGPGHRIDISLPTPICNNEIIDNMLDGQPTPGTSAIERDTVPGENQDIPRLNNSFKKINVIPETPSTQSPSTKLTTVTETNKENESETNGMEIGSDWSVAKSADIPKCIKENNFTARDSGLVKLDDNTPDRVNEPSEFDWRPVNSGDIPQCINGSISTARNSVKSNNNASGRMNSVDSADPQKSIENSHSTRDNWSSTTPRCIMDPPVEVGISM